MDQNPGQHGTYFPGGINDKQENKFKRSPVFHSTTVSRHSAPVSCFHLTLLDIAEIKL